MFFHLNFFMYIYIYIHIYIYNINSIIFMNLAVNVDKCIINVMNFRKKYIIMVLSILSINFIEIFTTKNYTKMVISLTSKWEWNNAFWSSESRSNYAFLLLFYICFTYCYFSFEIIWLKIWKKLKYTFLVNKCLGCL